MSNRDQTGSADQAAGTSDDATMSGSPKGGGTSAAGATGPGRYGGAEAADDANALEAGTTHSSGLDPLGGPGANAGQDVGGANAMSTHGGPSRSTATSGSDETQRASAGEWADRQVRERTQPWGSGDPGEVN